MFIDQVDIKVKAGKGGDGMISFRREKYIPKGGPNGGNGGRGASIIFRASHDLNTLYPFRYKKKIVADDGNPGETKNMYGRGSSDVYIDVPVGTIITDKKDNKLIADLDYAGKEVMVVKGGRGGRGNASFKSNRNKAPKIAENGEPGEEKELHLELKLIADAGLIGLPNVGKSTLLSVLTNAKPEIGNFEFTTKEPMLGVVEYMDKNFVLTDLPGLIEGASVGKGLGLKFLKHVERCRLLIHVLDLSHPDPLSEYNLLRHELANYSTFVQELPEIIIGTKLDLEGAAETLSRLKSSLPEKEILGISALTHFHLEDFKAMVLKTLDDLPERPVGDPDDALVLNYKFVPETERFFIDHSTPNLFIIKGEYIEKKYQMSNLSNEEGVARFLSFLRRLGVDDELNRLSIKEGDTVRIGDYEFEYVE